jgi:hypothetical protein
MFRSSAKIMTSLLNVTVHWESMEGIADVIEKCDEE